MLPAVMAMRLREIHGSSQQVRPWRSLNGFGFAVSRRETQRERPFASPVGRALYCLSCERALVGEHLPGHDIGVELHRAVARRGDLNMMAACRQPERLRR